MVQDQEKRNIELLYAKDYDTLLKENEKLVYFVLNKFKGIPYDDREDYYQLGMLTLYNCALKYDLESDAKFSTYVIVALNNAYINAMRSYNKIIDNEISYNQKINNEDGEMDDELLYFLAVEDNMDNDILVKDLYKVLKEIIPKLTERQQIYVYKYLVERKNYRQIADEENRSHQAVHNGVTRALERLQILLKIRGIDENYF